MSQEGKNQKQINRVIYNAFVPKGLRPESIEDIDGMLDAIGGQEYSDDKFQRMMQKIKGEEPLHANHNKYTESFCEEITESESELMAMHRDGSEKVSPDSQKKLDEMRNRVRKHDEEREEDKNEEK